MTNEDLERKIEFIIEHQAQFTTDIQQLGDGLQQLRDTQAQTEQVVTRLANVTFQALKDVNSKIDALVDSHIRLTESQSRTDENLRNLIAVVDRYFRDRNGDSKR